jgi:hypothetical protein
MRRNRSFLLSRPEVYGQLGRARCLRAGLLPLFPMHQRPAILLSTAGLWRPLLYSAMCVNRGRSPFVDEWRSVCQGSPPSAGVLFDRIIQMTDNAGVMG